MRKDGDAICISASAAKPTTHCATPLAKRCRSDADLVRLNDTPLLTAHQIQERIVQLGATISHDYAERQLVVLVVLKGGMFFAADLIRALTIPVTMDFLRASSYDGAASRGEVRLRYRPETTLSDKDVLIVEDILDTGQTTEAVQHFVRKQLPASIRLCVLLDKPTRRVCDVKADYVGFGIGDHFVVGYGLDHNEQYRGLRAIHILKNV